MKNRFKLFGDIAKMEPQDDGTLIVCGFASSEAVDSAGEVVTAEAMKAAIPDYMAFANVREMHDATKAAGTALTVSVQDDGKTYIEAHIVDAGSVKKCEAGVLKGFSIGGKVTGRDEIKKNTITGLKLTEISLVDRPANPEAVFSVFKAEGQDEEHDLRKWAGQEVWDAGEAISCLKDIQWLIDMEQSEAEDYPEQMAALRTAFASLKAFVISELQEDHSAKAATIDDIAKAGKAISAANIEKLKSAIAILESMSVNSEEGDGENEDNSKAAGAGDDIRKAEDLQKSLDDLKTIQQDTEKKAADLQNAVDAIAKACTDAGAPEGTAPAEFIAKMAARITELEDTPDDRKSPKVFDITKVQDNGGKDDSGNDDAYIVRNADGSVNDAATEIKKIHAGR